MRSARWMHASFVAFESAAASSHAFRNDGQRVRRPVNRSALLIQPPFADLARAFALLRRRILPALEQFLALLRRQ